MMLTLLLQSLLLLLQLGDDDTLVLWCPEAQKK